MKIHVLVLVLLFGALACGPAAQAPSAPSSDPKQPRSGGTLNTTFTSDPNDWDVRTQGKTGVNVEVHGHAYDTLLRFKKGPDIDHAAQELVPRIAGRWEVSPDAKSFTFHLRKGARFHNLPPVNGRELTSADVKWSMEYYSAKEMDGKKLPTSSVEVLFEGLDRVDTPDPYTAVVRFKEPYVPFIYYTASQWMPMAAKEVYQQDGSLKDTLIGTGPFIFDPNASQKGTVWVVKKNSDYWDKGKPYLDTIRRLVLVEDASAQAAFQSKQLDLWNVTIHNQAQEMMKAAPQAQVYKHNVPIGNALLISQRRGGPLADARVRRAISLAIDRDEHSRILYGGDATPYLAGSWPGLFSDAEVRQMLRYDPEEAKRLLAQAGYPSNTTLEIIITTSENDTTQHQLLQAQLKKVGIDMKITALAREVHRPRLYTGDFDFYRNSGGGLLEADADSFLFGEFYGGSSLNWAVIKDPELDQHLLRTRREAEPEKRREAMRAAVKRINDQGWDPGIVYPANWAFSQPYVKDWRRHFDRGEDESFVWLDK